MAKKPKHNPIPWDFLDKFRGEGKLFNAEWPTLKELFDITTTRYILHATSMTAIGMRTRNTTILVAESLLFEG